MFPNVGQEAIINDLQRTHSVEATADNILEGLVSSQPPTNTVNLSDSFFENCFLSHQYTNFLLADSCAKVTKKRRVNKL